ncbi:hypothetical protein DERF_004997 [Dermatophagoides farinae]|uniref:Uncharacterized protein n=1 Tax=Dermatophagoides farinae TaxID=6954 RepID=A0A922I631_DERFA|nr:hypothetical protein DERF_004997 [Dermatophagoides farinae]
MIIAIVFSSLFSSRHITLNPIEIYPIHIQALLWLSSSAYINILIDTHYWLLYIELLYLDDNHDD